MKIQFQNLRKKKKAVPVGRASTNVAIAPGGGTCCSAASETTDLDSPTRSDDKFVLVDDYRSHFLLQCAVVLHRSLLPFALGFRFGRP